MDKIKYKILNKKGQVIGYMKNYSININYKNIYNWTMNGLQIHSYVVN